MAELDVQPKTGKPWWIWLLLALIVVAMVFLFKSCEDNPTNGTGTKAESDTIAVIQAVTTPNWENVDFDAPALT